MEWHVFYSLPCYAFFYPMYGLITVISSLIWLIDRRLCTQSSGLFKDVKCRSQRNGERARSQGRVRGPNTNPQLCSGQKMKEQQQQKKNLPDCSPALIVIRSPREYPFEGNVKDTCFFHLQSTWNAHRSWENRSGGAETTRPAAFYT